jgi:VWFA-related protein
MSQKHSTHLSGLRVLLISLFAVGILHAQSVVPNNVNPVATFESKVRVVVVDVVVTNEKGEPVTALDKANFKILEDGKAQTIASFEEHKGVAAVRTKLPPLPPGVFTNFPASTTNDSVNVLLLDALNTPVRDQTFVHAQLIKFLKTVPPGARIAVFTLTSRLRMLQEFTTDSTVLLAAVNDQKGLAGLSKSPLLRSEQENASIEYALGSMADNQPRASNPRNLQEEGVDPVNAIKALLAEETSQLADARVRTTLLAMHQLASYLSGFPGRKNVVWFSGSFPLAILPSGDLVDPFAVSKTYIKELQRITNLLTTAQVAIYPVAAEGLMGDALYESNANQVTRRSASQVIQSQNQQLQSGDAARFSNRATMEELAKDTGGKAFLETNGMSDVLARLTNNGAYYYTLSYAPTNKKIDGGFRKISVQLEQKYKLAYRRGYYAQDKKREEAGENELGFDPLRSLVGFGLPNVSQIIYKLRVVTSDPQPAPDAARIGGNTELKGPVTRYDLDFAVAPNDIKLDSTPDGRRQGNIEIRLVAYDPGGLPLNMVGRKIPILLDPKVYAALQKVGLQIHEQIDVPSKGDVYLRTGIYDLNSGNAGTLGIKIGDAAFNRK